MEGGFPYGDIVVIAAIAAFIVLRYRAMLGEKSGRDLTDLPRNRPLDDLEPVIQLPEREVARKKETSEKPAAIAEPAAFAEQFAAMRAIDKDFAAEDFVDGARAAFAMVIDAYNTSDHETLAMLLSERIYGEFKASLAANEAAGRSAHTTLVAIVKSQIVDVRLLGSKATITVDFLSEQVPLVRDSAGAIIEGDASTREAIADQWIFERDLKSADPAWKIIET